MSSLTIATRDRYALAEGPVWDARHRLIRWVDIIGGRVLAGRLLAEGTIEIIDDRVYDDAPTAVLPTADGLGLGLAIGRDVTVDDVLVASIIDDAPGVRRTNDAKPDPQGRLIVGTLAYEGGSQTEVLARVEPDATVTVLDDDIQLSNGIAFTADGRTMYSIDTGASVVYARDYTDGVAGPRRVHLQFDDVHPDGACIDADDHLWIAMWGAGAVHRYAPDGTLVSVLDVPALQPTSVAFVGDDLGVLCITSAAVGVDAEHALGSDGALFTIDVGVRGVPVQPWLAPVRREGQK